MASDKQKFDGTESYVATDDLKVAVNAAMTLERPFTNQRGTGDGQNHAGA